MFVSCEMFSLNVLYSIASTATASTVKYVLTRFPLKVIPICVPTKLIFFSKSVILLALANSFKNFPIVNHRKITKFLTQADLKGH